MNLLKDRPFWQSILLAIFSWGILSVLWGYFPEGGIGYRAIQAVMMPSYRLGRYVGALVLSVIGSGTDGALPLFGVLGVITVCTAFWYVVLTIRRAARTNPVEQSESPESRSRSFRKRTRDKDFDFENEPEYVSTSHPDAGRLGLLKDLIGYERTKVAHWRAFREQTGRWPLFSICFRYGTFVLAAVGIWLLLPHIVESSSVPWRYIAFGVGGFAVWVALVIVGEGLMRKLDSRLYGPKRYSA